MVRRTVPMLVQVAKSSVDGRPFRTTCGTDPQVIHTGVDGALGSIDKQLFLEFQEKAEGRISKSD